MNKKVIFHIGCPKTGTSFIQNTFAQNRAALSNHGIAYHQLNELSFACHWRFAIPFFEDLEEYWPVRTAISRGDTKDLLITQGNDSLESFHEEIISHDTVLISAEHFFFLPTHVIKKISEYFHSLDLDVTVVTFVRNPIQLAESQINQSVKMGLGCLHDLTASPRTFNEKANITKYVNCFGDKNNLVFDYEHAINHSGGLIGFFCNEFNIPFSNLNLPDRESGSGNNSLSYEALTVFDRINPLLTDAAPHSKMRNSLVGSLSKIEGNIFSLNSLQRKVLYDNCHEDMLYLVNNWKIDYQSCFKKEQPNPTAINYQLAAKAYEEIAYQLLKVMKK